MKRLYLIMCLALLASFSAWAQVPQKGTKAYEYYQKAITGEAEAQNNLGFCYENGQGVTKSLSEAVKWYRKAAEQGYANAQTNLGFCYKLGNGVTQDYSEAVKWYHKAAEQDNSEAQCNLGFCYYNGNGVTKDDTEAAKWFRKAAEQGDDIAQYSLGYLYYNGHGVTQDYTEAANWFHKAAEQGYADAQYNLGCCHYYGNGVAKDYSMAVKWYRKAAEQGYADAQYILGFCYENGQGVTKSLSEAVKWYRKAAAQGNNLAKLFLKRLGYSENSGESAASQAIGSGQSGNKSTVSGEVYQWADNMPEFPGGQGAMFRWLGENLKYPPIALEEGIQGRVLIHFVVTKTGEIADAKVAKSVNPALDKEALRLVRSMPRFTPAKMQGKPVNCYYTLPVTFRITTN